MVASSLVATTIIGLAASDSLNAASSPQIISKSLTGSRSEPSLDFAWGPVPDGASQAREWEEAWLDQSVAVLDFRSPRHSAASAAEGGTAEALRLEGLLRQLEYQAGLAAARGEKPIDTEWLRTELGLTSPLSEHLP